MRRTFLLFATLLAAHAAQAQTVYRSVMPDGSIVYGDKAVQGARDAREIELPPPPALEPEPAAQRPGGPARVAADPVPPAGMTLDAAQAEVVRASQALDRARAAQASGREPLAGETVGTAIPGRMRRTDAYELRQKALGDAVEAAQRRLDAALDRRNALR
jgi:hypothetical protein